MQRKDFLKGVGFLGLGTMLNLNSPSKILAQTKQEQTAFDGDCVLIPSETAGPYPLDLSSNSAMFRQDIREGKAGTQLDLTLTLVNVNDNCKAIPNARIDIWHCDKDGYYSGYSNPGYLGTQNNIGKTFFRGIQMTDANGQVKFTTIYPGWYNGRVTHVHFQVFLNSVLSATSQFAFPESITTDVYNSSLYSSHGQNNLTIASDNVFSDGTSKQMLTVSNNSQTGGFDGGFKIGIAAPTTGVINLDPDSGGQFKLLNNYPNPMSNRTTIPFEVKVASKIKIELFDMSSRKVGVILDKYLESGSYDVELQRNFAGFDLPSANYIYELTSENENGLYRSAKVLTVK